MKPRTPLTVVERAELELLTAYERQQTEIRANLTGRIYWNGLRMLQDWQAFQAEFAEGGRYEALTEQLAADMAIGITAQETATLIGYMQGIIATMDAIEARVPGMFGIASQEELPRP